MTVTCADECSRAVGDRIANLALATEPAARIFVCEDASTVASDIVLHLQCASHPVVPKGMPVIALASEETPAPGRFLAAFQSSRGCREVVLLVPDEVAEWEHAAQASAVGILDGVCAVLSAEGTAVVP